MEVFLSCLLKFSQTMGGGRKAHLRASDTGARQFQSAEHCDRVCLIRGPPFGSFLLG
jgi:hypothetical protein